MSLARFHVVVVSKYIGVYDRGWNAYAVADRARANRCLKQKYDSKTEAQAYAALLNQEQPAEIDPTCVFCAAGEPHEH